MWSFTASLFGLGQHLGLHLDCTEWKIPDWEKGLRKRLAWALFIQDSFSAMILGRPCLVSPEDWAVVPLQDGDFPEGSDNGNSNGDDGGGVSIEDGKLLFINLAKLSVVTSRMVRQLYSVNALATVLDPEQVLAVAEPLESDITDLLHNLPPGLKMDYLQQGHLCANASFHLALEATTVFLNRRILWSIQNSAVDFGDQFSHNFRAAQRKRAGDLVQLISALRPEHMEAFWFFAAGGCGVILGSFLGLLRVTSTTAEESEELKALMNEFEWQLRIKAKMGDWVLYTLTRLKSLGWDRWKTFEPDPNPNSRDGCVRHQAGSRPMTDTVDGAVLLEPYCGISTGLTDEDNSTVLATEDIDSLAALYPSWIQGEL